MEDVGKTSSIARKMKPPIDLAAPDKTETATFAMGLFWDPDSRFGSISRDNRNYLMMQMAQKKD